MRCTRQLAFCILTVLCATNAQADYPVAQWKAWQEQSTQRVPGESWRQYSRPEDAGWSAEKLAEAKAYYDSLDAAAAIVIYDGAVLAAWGDVDRRYPCHSMRKSLLSAVYGVHVANGRVDLNKTLADLNIDDQPPLTDDEKQARVIDLLRSRSGVYHPAAYETQSMKETRPARGSHRPGEVFWYNNWDFNTLCTILEQESGTRVFEQFQSRFATPLQMEDYRERDGYYHLESEHSQHPAYPFCMSARDLARLGLLYLREGRWADKEILTKQWVQESVKSHFTDQDTTRVDEYGYGYLWWPIVHGPLQQLGVYSARGYGGHAIDVVPGADLVLVLRVDTYWDVCSYLQHDRHRVEVKDRLELLSKILAARVGPPAPQPSLTPLPTTTQDPPTIELPSEVLDRYAKLYQFDKFQIRVKRLPDGLTIGQPGKIEFRLLPRSPHEFYVEDVQLGVSFELDDQGQPRQMTIARGEEIRLVSQDVLFDFEWETRNVPKPRDIWPIVQQHTIPREFTVLSDELMTSNIDPSQKLRKVTAHFWSQQIGGKNWGHQCVIFLPEDNSRNLTDQRLGKVVIVGSPPRAYFPIHVDKYGEPIAARTGYPTMVMSNPGEYPDGSDIESDIRILDRLQQETGENYYNMNCQLAVSYIQAMNALQEYPAAGRPCTRSIGGHSKRGRSATVAAAIDPRVASVIIMGNEGVFRNDQVQWHLSFHHAFFQDQVNVPVFYLGATNEDGYKMFNVNLLQEQLRRPMTIEMIPNYCHSNFSEIQYMDFLMWVSHVFDERPDHSDFRRSASASGQSQHLSRPHRE